MNEFHTIFIINLLHFKFVMYYFIAFVWIWGRSKSLWIGLSQLLFVMFNILFLFINFYRHFIAHYFMIVTPLIHLIWKD